MINFMPELGKGGGRKPTDGETSEKVVWGVRGEKSEGLQPALWPSHGRWLQLHTPGLKIKEKQTLDPSACPVFSWRTWGGVRAGNPKL